MKVCKFIRENKVLSAAALIIISIFITMIPVRSLLDGKVDYPDAILIEPLLLQGILLLISCLFLKVLGDNKFLGLKFEYGVKDIYVIWPLIIFAIMSAAGNIGFIESIDVGFRTYILYIAAFIITGFFEEFMLRGVALRIFIDRYGDSKKGIKKAVLVSNLVFTLCCLNMLFSGQGDLITTIFKMFNMFCLGVLYCAVFLRTKTIWVNIILHSLIELLGSIQALTLTSREAFEGLMASSAVTIQMAAPVILISILLLIVGLWFLKKIK